MDLDWLVIILQLIFLEGILSIDNAAVLGALVTPLPDDQPVPWPRSLQPISHSLDPILGNQRVAALKVGLLTAYLGRGLMLFLAHFVIRNRWLQLLGGSYLIYLAIKQLVQRAMSNGDDHNITNFVGTDTSFWKVVLTVELADLAFSLDNVVAAVALSKELWVVLLGVGLGILTMRFAAQIFTVLVAKEPILEPAAYVLVLIVGIRVLLEQLLHIEISTTSHFGLSIFTLVGAFVYARWDQKSSWQK